MKHSKLFAFFFSLMLLLAISSLSPSQLADANFLLPPAPPEVRFLSPVNTTYSSNDISLIVEFYTYKTGYYGAPEDESLREFQYSIDEASYLPITITNSSVGRNPGNDVSFQGAIRLSGLNEGLHNLTIQVVFDYSDLNYPYKVGNYSSEHYNFHTESNSTVYLIVDNSSGSTNNNLSPNLPEAPPLLPIVISIAILGAIVAISILFIARRGKKPNLAKVT